MRLWTLWIHSVANHTGFQLFWSEWARWGLFFSFPACPPFQYVVPSQDTVRLQGTGLVVVAVWRGRWEQPSLQP